MKYFNYKISYRSTSFFPKINHFLNYSKILGEIELLIEEEIYDEKEITNEKKKKDAYKKQKQKELIMPQKIYMI